MTQTHSRYIQVGDWFFELKSIRALKVDEYGKPYTAIANCNINGDTMYVDGLLTKGEEEFTKLDFLSFCQLGQKIGIDSINYHRFQEGESVNKEVRIKQNKQFNVTPSTKKHRPEEENLANEGATIRLVK